MSDGISIRGGLKANSTCFFKVVSLQMRLKVAMRQKRHGQLFIFFSKYMVRKIFKTLFPFRIDLTHSNLITFVLEN